LSGDFMGAFSGEGSKSTGLDDLIRRLEREEFDLIAVGRALLGDPRWVTKVRTGDLNGLQDFSAAAMGALV